MNYVQSGTHMVAYIAYARRQCNSICSCYSHTKRGANLAQETRRILRSRPSSSTVAQKQGVCRQALGRQRKQDAHNPPHGAAAHDWSNAHVLNVGGGRRSSRLAGRTRRGGSNYATETAPKHGMASGSNVLIERLRAPKLRRSPQLRPWLNERAREPQSVESGATTEAGRKNTAFGTLPKIELAKLTVNRCRSRVSHHGIVGSSRVGSAALRREAWEEISVAGLQQCAAACEGAPAGWNTDSHG